MKNIQDIIEKLKNKKILVVEDDTFLSKLIVDTFTIALGASNIFMANDGQEGYAKYQQISPDVVITDIRMPNMNGREMAQLIKADNSTTPIIVLSGYTQELGNEDRVDSVLSKPVDFNVLFRSIGELVA
jgi:chemosensory pili system protein ChpA (sensor histidine kinase/response regulator)